MPNCAIPRCYNYTRKTKNSEIKYFRFPTNSVLSEQWIAACKREDKFNVKNSYVCSEHFTEASFEVPLKYRLLQNIPKNCRTLKSDAVPTLKIPNRKLAEKIRTAMRFRKRKQIANVDVVVQDAKQGSSHGSVTDTSIGNKQTDWNSEVIELPGICGGGQEAEGLGDYDVSKIKQEWIDITEHDVSKQLEERLTKLEQENIRLVEENRDLKLSLELMNSILQRKFTPGQIKKLMHPERTRVKISRQPFQ